MNPLDQIVGALHLALALFALWALLWCWRCYRVDAFRQRLFDLRDELFDFAASGHIPFDHPAYGRLRTAMNGMIQFGHRLTFTRLCLTFLLFATSREIVKPFEQWVDAVNEIDSAETRQQLLAFHDRMGEVIFSHLCVSNPIFAVLVIIAIATSIVSAAAKQFLDAFKMKGLELLEAQAVEAQMDIQAASGFASI